MRPSQALSIRTAQVLAGVVPAPFEARTLSRANAEHHPEAAFGLVGLGRDLDDRTRVAALHERCTQLARLVLGAPVVVAIAGAEVGLPREAFGRAPNRDLGEPLRVRRGPAVERASGAAQIEAESLRQTDGVVARVLLDAAQPDVLRHAVVEDPEALFRVVERDGIGRRQPFGDGDSEREARGRVGFFGEDHGPSAGGRTVADEISEPVVHEVRERRHHPRRRDLLPPLSRLLEGATGDEERSEVPLGELRVVRRGEPRLQIVRVAFDRHLNECLPDPRHGDDIESSGRRGKASQVGAPLPDLEPVPADLYFAIGQHVDGPADFRGGDRPLQGDAAGELELRHRVLDDEIAPSGEGHVDGELGSTTTALRGVAKRDRPAAEMDVFVVDLPREETSIEGKVPRESEATVVRGESYRSGGLDAETVHQLERKTSSLGAQINVEGFGVEVDKAASLEPARSGGCRNRRDGDPRAFELETSNNVREREPRLGERETSVRERAAPGKHEACLGVGDLDLELGSAFGGQLGDLRKRVDNGEIDGARHGRLDSGLAPQIARAEAERELGVLSSKRHRCELEAVGVEAPGNGCGQVHGSTSLADRELLELAASGEAGKREAGDVEHAVETHEDVQLLARLVDEER